ncbi:NrfD/PsrC family molybdoenzyme membrane anchor subunit [Fulvivirga ligni]|uniref:NrfD/PsrC family molybdoenzyme membrane anchor subunit n=1 Tax=Fulvivirga ligni TaxID=2904246 RepID=UPI001F3AC26B|nr:NrfD/PsrC family molybdoenzyme membrane anchor subunit [Fulvivirga ligni]UII24144.1 polysulfide reductase NrfD [Fulvivirga ligni]
MQVTSSVREPLVTGGKTVHDVTEDICRQVEGKPSKSWMLGVAVSLVALLLGAYAVFMLLWEGIGVWGLNKTIGWAWDITNFVWWVGIGHAGTLISAILLLFRQKWRMSINRAAEAMTIFAVICAACFPGLHMGRLWLGFYWALPLPNAFGSLWVNFNSPLLWDVFAVSTYFTVSLVFWYIGLIPDFASIRDRATNKISKLAYGVLSFGWDGAAKTWSRYESVALILAGLATPLVLSVHTIVSFDFATSVIPGWHSTIFPPYFVAGAIFSGFAMVQTLLLISRRVLKLEDYITREHVELMNIIIIVTGGVVAVAYATEFFIGWYTGVEYENYTYMSYGAATGPYAWAFWALIICNILIPSTLWFRSVRTSYMLSFIISIVINIGMWFERFDIIVMCLSRDYLPSSWAMFHPTIYDVGVYVFTLGLFFTLFLLFSKFFPVINMAEVKSIIKSSSSKQK